MNLDPARLSGGFADPLSAPQTGHGRSIIAQLAVPICWLRVERLRVLLAERCLRPTPQHRLSCRTSIASIHHARHCGLIPISGFSTPRRGSCGDRAAWLGAEAARLADEIRTLSLSVGRLTVGYGLATERGDGHVGR